MDAKFLGSSRIFWHVRASVESYGPDTQYKPPLEGAVQGVVGLALNVAERVGGGAMIYALKKDGT